MGMGDKMSLKKLRLLIPNANLKTIKTSGLHCEIYFFDKKEKWYKTLYQGFCSKPTAIKRAHNNFVKKVFTKKAKRIK